MVRARRTPPMCFAKSLMARRLGGFRGVGNVRNWNGMSGGRQVALACVCSCVSVWAGLKICGDRNDPQVLRLRPCFATTSPRMTAFVMSDDGVCAGQRLCEDTDFARRRDGCLQARTGRKRQNGRPWGAPVLLCLASNQELDGGTRRAERSQPAGPWVRARR
jgi:hypothetical protein